MVENVGTKGVIGLTFGVFGYFYNCINEMLVILGVLMVMDYISGLTAAFKTKSFNADIGRWGLIKKLFYAFIVLMGFIIDYIIVYLSKNVGIDLPFNALFGIVITLYLIGTEGFSMCQNLIIIGLPVPEIVSNAFGLIKDQAGKIKLKKESTENEKSIY